MIQHVGLGSINRLINYQSFNRLVDYQRFLYFGMIIGASIHNQLICDFVAYMLLYYVYRQVTISSHYAQAGDHL